MLRSYWQDLKQQWHFLPKGVGPLLLVEMCELYGRFSVVALLIFYLADTMHVADHQAFALYAGFMTLLYAMPVLGGWMADRLLGPVLAVVSGVILMAVGDGFLTIASMHHIEMGLVLIVLGSCVFTPTIAALLHHLYGGRPQDQDTGFMLFYLAKNSGALLAPLVGGVIANVAGYPMAFAFSALVMLFGLVVFVMACQRGRLHVGKPNDDLFETVLRKPRVQGMHFYRRFHPVVWGVLFVVLAAPVLFWVLKQELTVALVPIIVAVVCVFLLWLLLSKTITRSVLCKILLTWMVVACFSAFLGQGGTTLNLFIERLVNRQLGALHFPASFFFTLDPLFMITIGPFLFVALGRAVGNMHWASALKKYALGLALLGLGFLVFTVAAMRASTGLVSMGYVVLAYAIFPLAELSVMPIAFSQVTSQAPDGLSSTMAGFLYLGMALASFATGRISDMASTSVQHAHWANYADRYRSVFSFSATVCLGVALLVFLLSLAAWHRSK